MPEELRTFLLGASIGVAFGLFRLSPPVPPSVAGVLGIVGIFVGWAIVSRLLG
jgi:XapX domain-containing protein